MVNRVVTRRRYELVGIKQKCQNSPTMGLDKAFSSLDEMEYQTIFSVFS
jgi:hypothetical protein